MIVGVLLLVCGIATAMPFEDVSSSANSPHVANLKCVSGTRNFNHIRRQSELNAGLTDDGLSFLMEVTVGHQVFNVTVDTGSSDTWLAGKDVECTPGWECDFGTLYDIANDRSFQLMPDLNIHLTYEDDTSVEGVVGTNSMTLAGFTVPSQEIGVIKQVTDATRILGLIFMLTDTGSIQRGRDVVRDLRSRVPCLDKCLPGYKLFCRQSERQSDIFSHHQNHVRLRQLRCLPRVHIRRISR